MTMLTAGPWLALAWAWYIASLGIAKVFGLYGRKGAFELGFDGDIVILDPEKPWKCQQEKLLTKGHVSCFDGLEGKGTPICTIIRGKVVASDGMYREDAVGYGTYVTPIK